VVEERGLSVSVAESGVTTRVYKFVVPVNDQPTRVTVPVAGVVLRAGFQDRVDEVVVWVWGDHDGDTRVAWWQVYGTGQPIPPGWVPVGTAQEPHVPLVCHVFEAPEHTVGAPGPARH
jgi:hypothetical protein